VQEAEDPTQGRQSLRELLGARVRLSGGYDFEPKWLRGRDFVDGTLERFIPGQNSEPAAVVRLDGPLTSELASGSVAVLELRHVRTTWHSDLIVVHVELCDFEVASESWKSRRRGNWVESHATFQVLSNSRVA
jgi:hypothetical protein